MTREDIFARLAKSKAIKKQSIEEMKEYLREKHFKKTGLVLADDQFEVW